jgi:uncharacterized protein
MHLAKLLYEGDAPHDYPEAFRLFKLMAEKDNDEAQFNVGMMFLEGLGVEKNRSNAFYWIKRSADQSNIDAMYQVSKMYKQGIGTSIDTVKANKYSEEAEELENEWWNWIWF